MEQSFPMGYPDGFPAGLEGPIRGERSQPGVYTDMDQWIEIRRAVVVEGLSKRGACRKFGIHWDTLRRILAHPAPPGYVRQRPPAKGVISPWLGRLRELIEANAELPVKQRYTAKRMWTVLVEEGFTGGYTTVKDAVRELRQQAPKEVFMPLVHPPGEAQVDFGHAVARIGGRLTKIAFFVMSLVHSDAMFVMAFPRECTEAFLEAHVKAFAFFGFVPRRISYDNTKTAVAQILGAHRRKLTTAFARLVGHYLFEPHFCRVRRANEKGVVEGAVKYSRLNFMVPVPQVDDYTQLNAYLVTCCRSDMTRRLPVKALSKFQMLEEDRAAGLAIPAERFDPRRLVSTTASSQALVRLDTNDYSVPVEYGHRPVVIKASTETVSLYHAGKLIARHGRCWGRHRQIFDPQHYLSLLERKPGSLDHGRPFEAWNLPEGFATLRRRLEAQREDGTREYIRVLLLLRTYSLARLTPAVEQALRWTAPTADAIKQLLIPAERPEMKTFHLAGREHLAGVTVTATDLACYSRLREVAHA
jgi:transposase